MAAAPSGGDLMSEQRDPTISQVAERAGVSRSTVSRVFSRPDLVNARTVERIRAAAEELGFAPNYMARALSTGLTGNIALIVPDISNPFFPPLIAGAQEAADQAGLCLFLGNSEEQPTREGTLISRFQGQVDGLVLASSRLSERDIVGHAERRPLVLINRDVTNVPRVLIDTAEGVAAAVEHLYRLGHRSVAYLSGPLTSWSSEQRRRAVVETAQRLGMVADVLTLSSPSFAGGQAAAPALQHSGATAAIAFDDVSAQGALAGLAALGVTVPGGFSIIGCDDALGPVSYPPLSTISSQSREAGRLAVRLLLDVMKSGLTDHREMLSTAFISRATTASPSD